MKKEVNGIVIDIKSKGLECPTIAIVEYEVEGVKHTIEETLKLKNEFIKLGFLPIGQRQVPKVKCKKGGKVVVIYDEKNPKKGHIKGNDGIINC